MLTKVRIEVEEETAEACVEALWKYEHAMQLAEARRFMDCWPVSVSSEGPATTPEEEYGIREHPWSHGLVQRSFFNAQLGRELVEEVIEYDEGIPGYRGRRVVRFVRTDMRSPFVPLRVKLGTVEAGSETIGDVVARVELRPPYEGEYADPQPFAVTSD